MSVNPDQAAAQIPPVPLEKGKVWDKVVENFILKTGAGAAIGGMSSFLFFRNPTMRATTFGFAVGTGFGIALIENKKKIDAAAF